MYIVVCYLAYLAISLTVTVWVARTLRKAVQLPGRGYHGNRELAAIELVSDKIRLVLLVPGAMHFVNLYVFNRCGDAREPA
jgi:hypothetical protein